MKNEIILFSDHGVKLEVNIKGDNIFNEVVLKI